MLGSVLLWSTFPWAPFGPMGRRRLLELAAAQTGSLPMLSLCTPEGGSVCTKTGRTQAVSRHRSGR